MAQPLISIIIPTHNMRQWLGEALDSILAQPGDNYEVIVVDDGSTDGTRALIESRYADKVHYHYQPNRGRGAARNVGVALSKGEYIQFFDADDLMEPDALGARLRFLQDHPEYAAAYSHALVFWDDDPAHPFEPANRCYYTSGDILRAEIQTPFLLPIMVLMRREWVERVGGMDETLKSNEDWHFWLKVAGHGGQFAYVDGPPVARYRARHNNPPSSALTHALSGIQALERLKPIIAKRPDYRSLRLDYAIAKWRYEYGVCLLKAGHRQHGVRQILLSFLHNRDHLFAKLGLVVLSFCVSADQIERSYLRLRSIVKRHQV